MTLKRSLSKRLSIFNPYMNWDCNKLKSALKDSVKPSRDIDVEKVRKLKSALDTNGCFGSHGYSGFGGKQSRNRRKTHKRKRTSKRSSRRRH